MQICHNFGITLFSHHQSTNIQLMIMGSNDLNLVSNASKCRETCTTRNQLRGSATGLHSNSSRCIRRYELRVRIRTRTHTHAHPIVSEHYANFFFPLIIHLLFKPHVYIPSQVRLRWERNTGLTF